MAHAVETHPQKAQIVEALLSGVSLRQIAATLDPPIHYTSLQRYKLGIVKPAVRNAHNLAKVLGKAKTISDAELAEITQATAKTAIQAQHVVDPYLARTAQHRKTIDASLKDASDAKDGRTVAALISTDLKGLELDARLTGRLDTHQQAAQQLYIVSPCVNVTIGERPAIDVTPSHSVEVLSCEDQQK